MNLFSRHKNTVVLALVLFAQLLALAVQVKRQTAEGPVRLLRLVAIGGLAPFERLFIHSGEGLRHAWSNYIDLRNVRAENQALRAEADRMRLERLREEEDARQARRIQALLEFKERWIDQTVAAQVIGTSGTESARVLYIDKGSAAGIKPDMPVITPDGVVGKVLAVFGDSSQVLLINDSTSGIGATLVNARLQGILKGSPTGDLQLHYIMGDEQVQVGEHLITSGGDRVFPKGLPIGTVTGVGQGRNSFLEIRVRPAVQLDHLEEVLVITAQKQREPDVAGLGPIRASDILAQHLPGVPQAPAAAPDANTTAQPNASGATNANPPATQQAPVATPASKPAGNTPAPAKAAPSGGKPATAVKRPASTGALAGAAKESR